MKSQFVMSVRAVGVRVRVLEMRLECAQMRVHVQVVMSLRAAVTSSRAACGLSG